MKNLIFIISTFCTLSALAVNITDVKVRAMDGFGGDTSAVATRCQIKAGDVYDPANVTRDVNVLNASGEFESVNADAQRLTDGVEIVFYVKRKMRYVEPLVVKGANYFSESKILKESGLKDGTLYSEGDLALAAAKVRLAYQKKHYYNAKVSPIAKVLEGGNNCNVTFLVDEGARMKVRNTLFAGLESAPDLDMGELAAVVGEYPWWNPIGWFTDAPCTADQRAQAALKVKDYLSNLGYLDVKVAEPRFAACEEEGYADLVYDVNLGTRYRIGKISLEGIKTYPEEMVREKSELPLAGEIASAKVLADAAHRISVVIGSGDSGLADTRVDIRKIPSENADDVLDIVFLVTEGVRVVLNDVKIEGNDYTKDKVIRREIALAPGDRMLADRAERSQKRLENLDYFSRVRYSLRPTNKGKDETGAEYRDLVYEVDEKSTGSFMVGIGASSVDSIYVSAEVSQSNFDLFAPSKYFRGGGQKARLFAQAGPRIQTYEVSVTEPYLFDRLLEFTVEAYRRQRWYDDYDIIRSGGGVSMAYPVKFWPTWDPFGRFGIRLSGEFIEFDDIEKNDWLYKNKTVSLKEEDRMYGDAFEPVVRLFWSHDNRNSYRFPSQGSRTQIFADLAAAGDNKYYKVGFNHRSYFNVWKKYNHVFMVGVRAESIDGLSDEVPIYNRLFLGGPKSIRGIEYRTVSPYARRLNSDGDVTNSYDPWGGQTLACLNFEYTLPVVKMFRVALFSDLGSVSADEFDLSDDFAWTVGIGLRLDIPMFPIRLDFGTPIEKPDHAEKEVFSFTVGYDF